MSSTTIAASSATSTVDIRGGQGPAQNPSVPLLCQPRRHRRARVHDLELDTHAAVDRARARAQAAGHRPRAARTVLTLDDRQAIPEGYPVPGETLVADHSARIDLDATPLPPGAVLAKTLVLSLDPYLRGMMAAVGKTTSGAPFEIGKPIYSAGVLKVLRSENPAYKPGDYIFGTADFAEYHVLTDLYDFRTLPEGSAVPWSVQIPHHIAVPVEYGSVPPYTFDDLALQLWMANVDPVFVNRRIRNMQSLVVTHSPFTGAPLATPVTVYTVLSRRHQKRNRVVRTMSSYTTRWYGPVIIIPHESRTTALPADVALADVNLFVAVAVHVLASGRVRQSVD